ncbi:hotdog fold thioesterase [Frankia sp. AiPs1]|uniref:PaaI family thioesterase n=1 Tax=Frankia sp. AiPs1 TaxID=573493 RepID=UPI00204326FC|nr:hotdog fold thioesterase [Frankia sp. AiPs1]MCM3920635.1 hotdog fold thioesterase [Frankia sp. AiPs1]
MTAADAAPAADDIAAIEGSRGGAGTEGGTHRHTEATGTTADVPGAGLAGASVVAADAARLAVQINAARGEIERRMGILLTEASPERLVATMPVEGNRQPYGLLHGGASVVLAETLGSVGANLDAPPGSMAVGIEISASHHRSATSGVVTAVATRIRGGRTLVTYDIRITDDAGRVTCTCRLTCMIRGGLPAGATESGPA